MYCSLLIVRQSSHHCTSTKTPHADPREQATKQRKLSANTSSTKQQPRNAINSWNQQPNAPQRPLRSYHTATISLNSEQTQRHSNLPPSTIIYDPQTTACSQRQVQLKTSLLPTNLRHVLLAVHEKSPPKLNHYTMFLWKLISWSTPWSDLAFMYCIRNAPRLPVEARSVPTLDLRCPHVTKLRCEATPAIHNLL